MAAILICLVVAGSLLGNSFVAGRMAVAAANMNWLPRIFATVGRIGLKPKEEERNGGGQEEEEETESPNNAAGPPQTTKSDAPINAIILSTILSALYILLGNFRALLTFNGLGEYSFFFLTVVGAIVLRFREPGLRRPYKPFVLVPAVFAVVSGFVVIRGAFFAPVLALVVIVVWVIGLVFYYARRRLAARRVE